MNSRHGLTGKYEKTSRGWITNIGVEESKWEEMVGGWRAMKSEGLVPDIIERSGQSGSHRNMKHMGLFTVRRTEMAENSWKV